MFDGRIGMTQEQAKIAATAIRGNRAKIVHYDDNREEIRTMQQTNDNNAPREYAKGGVIPWDMAQEIWNPKNYYGDDSRKGKPEQYITDERILRMLKELENYELPEKFDKVGEATRLAKIQEKVEEARAAVKPHVEEICQQPSITRNLGKEYEHVNHPPHYQGKVEAIDYIWDKLTKEEYIGFLKGSILKYVSRLGKKEDDLADAKKATWYLAKLIQAYEKESYHY